MPWECFTLAPNGLEDRALRRYAPSSLGAEHLHDAKVPIEPGYARLRPDPADGGRYHDTSADGFMNDPRWPASCACGYRFAADDAWQVTGDLHYYAFDGRRFPMGAIPIGGIIDAWWLPRTPMWCGADGRSLMVKLPPGGRFDWWTIDGPSSSQPGQPPGPGWTRTGIPPAISVTPSISTPKYHGWLGVNAAPPGWLSDPL